jgi:hypothetical protein
MIVDDYWAFKHILQKLCEAHERLGREGLRFVMMEDELYIAKQQLVNTSPCVCLKQEQEKSS